MIINLTGTIDEKMFNTLIESVKEYSMADKPVMQVMLCSGGGQIAIADAIREVIQDLEIPLVAYGQISSAALDLFMRCKTERHIVENTFGVYHRTTLVVPTNEDGSVKHQIRSTIEAIQTVNPNDALVESWLEITKEEKKLVYEFDGDLGLNTDRLNLMLNNSIESGLDVDVELDSSDKLMQAGAKMFEEAVKRQKKIELHIKKSKKVKK